MVCSSPFHLALTARERELVDGQNEAQWTCPKLAKLAVFCFSYASRTLSLRQARVLGLALTFPTAMPRYAAFLRGISPMNATMPQLKRCFEVAGFSEVRTILTSGNVVFDARAGAEAALERRAEDAMQQEMGRSFLTIVRSLDALRDLVSTDPYAGFELPDEAKRIATFLRAAPSPEPSLPLESNGARILRLEGREVFSAYVPNQRGAVFMTLIEKTFGQAVTTRTWETVKKVARRMPGEV
jgi:uncharacterized protein (DUF1697 family)